MITTINDSNKNIYKTFFNLSSDDNQELLENIFGTTYDSKKSFLPLDEELFDVNADTRTITVPTNFRVNGFVTGDHMAEMLFFIVDRYYDTQDLSKTNIDFLWKTSAGKEGVTRAAFKSTTFYKELAEAKGESANNIETKLFFGWPLTNNAISSSGQLQFSITFFQKMSSQEIEAKQNAIIQKYNTLISEVESSGDLNAEEKAAQIQAYEQQKNEELEEFSRKGSDIYRLSTLPAILNVSNGLTVNTLDDVIENKEGDLEQLIRNRFSQT